MRRRVKAAIGTGLCALVVAASWSPAAAQPRLAPEAAPWAEGVAEADQVAAIELYERGNAEFVGSRFGQALALYRQAIARWDHPAIRFNLAVCLINLDQPVEARVQLEGALAFGAAPLGDDLHQQALTYRKLLDAQLGRVEVHAEQAGAVVTVDGLALLTGPGTERRWLLPGDHQLVATGPGFLTSSQGVHLVAGGHQRIDVDLQAIATPPRMVRRWPRWKPVAVLAGGGALAGLGAAGLVVAQQTFDAYDDGVADACPCGPADAAIVRVLDEQRQHGERQRLVAYALVAGGATLVVAGAVALYLDRARPLVVEPVPIAGGAALAIGGRF